VVYFIDTLWHGGGANVSDKPRKSATVQYCQPYIRPIENQILAVDPRKLDEINPKIIDMMGYKVMAPFMGYGESASLQVNFETWTADRYCDS
jgi:ectoine hydroxylase-related dioxygenase (phytanoyl-CoA dioxygenase family)